MRYRRGKQSVIDPIDDLFEPPPSWLRSHPFAARLLALGLVFALLAPLAAAFGAWTGGDGPGPNTVAGGAGKVDAVIDSAVTSSPDNEVPATDAVLDTQLQVVDSAPATVPDAPASSVADTGATVAPAPAPGPEIEATAATASRPTIKAPPTTAKAVTTTKAVATTKATTPPTTVKATTTTRPKAPTPTTSAPKPTTTAPRRYGSNEIEALIRASFPADPDTAMTIARRESNLNPTVYNGWCCYGLFQINWSSHKSWLSGIGVTRAEQLLDAATNVKAATWVYLRAGGWGPWSTAP